MQFLQNGWGDLGAGIASIILIAGGFLLQLQRLRRRREQSEPSNSQPASEVRSAQSILLRVIDSLPRGQWLEQQDGMYYRITPFEGGFLVERVECETWPPAAGSKIRVESVLAQPDQDHALRFSVDVTVADRGSIPPSVRVMSNKFIIGGRLHDQTLAEASEIIQWMEALN